MEDANGGLSIPKGSIPTIRRKIKTTDDYEGWRMGGSWQKDTGNNTIASGLVSGFNISKEKTTEGMMIALGKLYGKPLASNKVFLMKRLFNMKMSEGGSIVSI